MSLMTRMGIRSTAASLFEILVVFSMVSFICSLVPAGVWALLAHMIRGVPFGHWYDFREWYAAMPVWMWFVELMAWTLLVIVYWTPGDEGANNTELRAFAFAFAILAAGAVGFLEHRFGAVSATFSVLIAKG